MRCIDAGRTHRSGPHHPPQSRRDGWTRQPASALPDL